MASVLFYPPHLVAALLDKTDIQQNIVLMDIFGKLKGECWSTEITVIFNPVSFSRNHGQTRSDFYLGYTGATVTMDLQKNGDFTHWTPAQEMTTEATINKELTRDFTVELKPEVEIKAKGIKASAGKVSGRLNKATAQKSTFEIVEFPIAPKKIGDTIEWNIQMPKGQKAVRDFLYGNTLLSATIHWAKPTRNGSFTLRASNIQFFNGEGELLSKRQNFAMRYLTRPTIILQNKEGLTFNFEIHE